MRKKEREKKKNRTNKMKRINYKTKQSTKKEKESQNFHISLQQINFFFLLDFSLSLIFNDFLISDVRVEEWSCGVVV